MGAQAPLSCTLVDVGPGRSTTTTLSLSDTKQLGYLTPPPRGVGSSTRRGVFVAGHLVSRQRLFCPVRFGHVLRVELRRRPDRHDLHPHDVTRVRSGRELHGDAHRDRLRRHGLIVEAGSRWPRPDAVPSRRPLRENPAECGHRKPFGPNDAVLPDQRLVHHRDVDDAHHGDIENADYHSGPTSSRPSAQPSRRSAGNHCRQSSRPRGGGCRRSACAAVPASSAR